jgi:hypothetical protein
MKINILSTSTTSLTIQNNGANVQGDELLARMWAKELGATLNAPGDHDISISFSPLLQDNSNSPIKVLYLQNVFPKPYWPGTVEMFQQHKHRYNKYIFTSKKMQEACEEEGLVCQFGTDPDIYYPDFDSNFYINCCFVGNNIRDKQTTEDYILSAKPYGLSIYGNPQSWNDECCKGKISLEGERKLYTSSIICLNAHLKEHLDYGTFNFRLFNIMACQGFIISDTSQDLVDNFDGCMVFVKNKTECEKAIEFYLKHPDYTMPFRQTAYHKTIENHTIKHRLANFKEWIQS